MILMARKKRYDVSPRQFDGQGPIEGLVAGLRLFGIILWILVMLPPYGLAHLTESTQVAVNRFFWKVLLRIAGISVRVRGEACRARPLVFVSNHVSYLDIPVLGSLLPGFFVAKADVARWPAMGWLASYARTVFIERKRAAAQGHKALLLARLAEGQPLIVFPEGTSSDGNRVLPFKSTLFSVAEETVDGREILVQPVAIAYTRCFGLPIGYVWRHFFAWYGGMEFGEHLWGMLHMGRLSVEVRLLPPVHLSAYGSRKALAAACEAEIREQVRGLLSGRDETALAPPAGLTAPLPAP